MSLRSCCYKNCKNYCINNAPCGSFTLFQFPKDAVRRKRWMQLGQVNPRIPPNNLFMCSDHFDRTKYMSVNPRRTILLGTAEPFPYVPAAEKNSPVAEASPQSEEEGDVDDVQCTEQDNTTYMFFEDDVEVGTDIQMSKEASDNQFPVESTIEDDNESNLLSYGGLKNDSDEQNHTNIYHSSEVTENGVCKSDISASKKRKVIEIVSGSNEKSTMSKLTAVKCVRKTQPQLIELNPIQEGAELISTADVNEVEQVYFDESLLINSKHVSTFIYKGEEYVQMPKDYFLKEKLNLLQKVEKYESILRSIKQQLNGLELD